MFWYPIYTDVLYNYTIKGVLLLNNDAELILALTYCVFYFILRYHINNNYYGMVYGYYSNDNSIISKGRISIWALYEFQMNISCI